MPQDGKLPADENARLVRACGGGPRPLLQKQSVSRVLFDVGINFGRSGNENYRRFFVFEKKTKKSAGTLLQKPGVAVFPASLSTGLDRRKVVCVCKSLNPPFPKSTGVLLSRSFGVR